MVNSIHTVSGLKPRKTLSVCPVCLKTIPAVWDHRPDSVYLVKSCPEHGTFSVPIWRNTQNLDEWLANLQEPDIEESWTCPHGCQSCAGHPQASCCVLLEVTSRCNLHCTWCFANECAPEPSPDQLKQIIRQIAEKGDKPLLQLSGGEPTMRDDLPELVAYAVSVGIPYIQLNTNGIRLAEDAAYANALSRAGLSFVFLQFDGTNDLVYQILRGRSLLEIKQKAIERMQACGLGVTLVPTIVRGVNDGQIGELLRYGASLSPTVRGVHFQPVSFFGRFPHAPEDKDRFTLDELVTALYEQGGLEPGSLRPSRCDHPLCGFHGSFYAWESKLTPISRKKSNCCCGAPVTPAQNRRYIGSRWKIASAHRCESAVKPDTNTLDGFLAVARDRSFTVTAMAFQDAMNFDVQRLRRCSLHVWNDGILQPFCARYVTPLICK